MRLASSDIFGGSYVSAENPTHNISIIMSKTTKFNVDMISI